mmetsp:Transcript_64537/g.120112  ORF Transcript_64537/g.120112 Transcript_64537/m.120112 type:complete len:216 (-) Transcript_64537:1797-2444(-)
MGPWTCLQYCPAAAGGRYCLPEGTLLHNPLHSALPAQQPSPAAAARVDYAPRLPGLVKVPRAPRTREWETVAKSTGTWSLSPCPSHWSCLLLPSSPKVKAMIPSRPCHHQDPRAVSPPPTERRHRHARHAAGGEPMHPHHEKLRPCRDAHLRTQPLSPALPDQLLSDASSHPWHCHCRGFYPTAVYLCRAAWRPLVHTDLQQFHSRTPLSHFEEV